VEWINANQKSFAMWAKLAIKNLAIQRSRQGAF
jgi:hypothetical protein